MSYFSRFLRQLRPLVEYFPSIAATYRVLREKQSLRRQPRNTPMGFSFAGHPAMESGNFEPAETAIVKALLNKSDILINVGANIGYYCCHGLQANKKVIAFEPLSGNLNHLLRNIRANAWQNNIEVFAMALSNRVGIIEIFGGGTMASLIKGWASTPEQYRELVPVSTMDTVLGSRFQDSRCLILVDIEGAELGMLEGSSGFLVQKTRPVWMVEICVGEHQPKGITINPDLLRTFEIFWSHGYLAYTANNQPRPVFHTEISEIINTGVDTLSTHNFLFMMPGECETIFGPHVKAS